MSRVIWAKYLILLLKTAIFMVEKIQKHIRAQKLDYNPVLIQYFMGKLVKRFGLAMIGLQSIGGSKIGGKHILCSNFAKFCSSIFLDSNFFSKINLKLHFLKFMMSIIVKRTTITFLMMFFTFWKMQFSNIFAIILGYLHLIKEPLCLVVKEVLA